MSTYEEANIAQDDVALRSINQGVSMNTYLSYTFINNSLFYPLLPSHLLDYYNRFVRRYFYWYDGFDPLFHTQYSGIFSTRIAYTLCNNLAQKVVGTNVMFDELKSSNKKMTNLKGYDGLSALETMENWEQDVDLLGKLNTAVSYMFAGGDSIIKINGSKKMPYPTVLRKDNYFITTDFSDKIINFTGLVYSYTSTKNTKNEKKDEDDYYYLLEERKFNDKSDKPQYRLFAKQGKGNVTHAKTIDLRDVQEVEWTKLPREFRKSIMSEYPNVTLGKWEDLPFEDSLGVYLFKNSESVSFIPQINMGESLLSNVISYLMSYDYYFSALNTDLYNGRGRVILPKAMQSPESKGSHFSELKDGYYTFVDYIDPENQKPTPIQFDLRANDWATISKILLRGIAMSFGVSERTIAQSLTEGTEKSTAREISVDDSTANFVTEKRAYMKKPLNCMVRDILSYFDFDDEVVVRFSRVGLTNMNEVVTQMTVLKQNDLVPLKEALEALFPDKNNKQIEDLARRIEKDKEMRVKLKEDNEKKPQEEEDVGTSDEGYEEQNNTDTSHIKKQEE